MSLFCQTTGDTNSPALLMLHGVGGNHSAFAPQLEQLNQQAYCLAWDMPGYGTSSLDQPLTWDSLCEQLITLLDQHGIEKVNLLGHSLGGMLALEFAARHADRLAGLILYATSPAFGNKDGDFQEKFLRARLGPLEAGATMADIASNIVPNMLHDKHQHLAPQLIAMMGQVTPEAYGQALRCITQFDQRQLLANIQVPVCLIAGDSDPNAPAAMMAKTASKIPQGSFHEIPDCGHFANLEAADAFNQIISQHLTRVQQQG